MDKPTGSRVRMRNLTKVISHMISRDKPLLKNTLDHCVYDVCRVWGNRDDEFDVDVVCCLDGKIHQDRMANKKVQEMITEAFFKNGMVKKDGAARKLITFHFDPHGIDLFHPGDMVRIVYPADQSIEDPTKTEDGIFTVEEYFEGPNGASWETSRYVLRCDDDNSMVEITGQKLAMSLISVVKIRKD